MTTSLKVFTACALFALAAPALAHGGGSGHGDQSSHSTTMSDNSSKITSTHDSRHTDQTKQSTQRRELVTKVAADVFGLLATYARDLASGNAAGARAIAKEIKSLSVLLSKNGLIVPRRQRRLHRHDRQGRGQQGRLHPDRPLISARTATGGGPRIRGALFAWRFSLRLGAPLPPGLVQKTQQIRPVLTAVDT